MEGNKMPDTMQAIRFYPPGGVKKLFLETTPIPTPNADQVLIEVHAVPIIYPELAWPVYQDAAGNYITHTPGHDFAGSVAAVGAHVTDPLLQPGKEVVAFTSFTDREGGMAQYALARAGQVVPKPAHLTFVEAASIPLSALTAWQALYDRGKVHTGQKVLVTGASGGTGLWMVQIARYIGAYVVGTATREESLEVLKEFGVDEAIDVKKDGLRKIDGKFDIVIDCVGGRAFDEACDAVKKDGLLVTISEEFGAKEKAAKHGANAIFFIVSMNANQLKKINELVEKGTLKTRIDSVWDFEDWKAAWAKCSEGHNRGKVVLKMKDA